MDKIKKIIVNREYKSIPDKFELEINDFTVITGENNSGKTNFIKTIDDGKVKFLDRNNKDITSSVEITYIPAESILGDDSFKVAEKNEVIKKLREFITGDPYFELSKTNKNNIKNLGNFFDVVNGNIRDMFDDGKSKNQAIEISIADQVKLKDIFTNVLEIKPFDYISGKQHEKFNDLGQGWQRLIIAVFLLTISEKDLGENKIRLILFEEPEAYLHPRFKVILNRMLKKLSSNPKSQVIITTHATAINGFSTDLAKNGGLNVYLKGLGITSKKYFWPATHGGGNEDMAMPLYIRNIMHHPDNEHTMAGKNNYDMNDLIYSIKELNKLI